MFFILRLFFLLFFIRNVVFCSPYMIDQECPHDALIHAIFGGQALLDSSDHILHEYFDIIVDDSFTTDMYIIFNFIIKRAILSFYSSLNSIDYFKLEFLYNDIPLKPKDFLLPLSQESKFYWVAFKSYVKSFIDFNEKNKKNKRRRIKSAIAMHYNELFAFIRRFHNIINKTITINELMAVAVFYVNELFWKFGDNALSMCLQDTA